MIAQRLGPLGKDHPRLVAVIDDRNQHRRILQPDTIAGKSHTRIEDMIADIPSFAILPLGNTLAILQDPPPEVGSGKCHQFSSHRASASSSSAGMIGNTSPPERTENIARPSISITSPSSTRSYMTARDTKASSRPRTRI